MILGKQDWLNVEVDHYANGFLSDKTETGRIVSIALADPPDDFILEIKRKDGFVAKARSSMCLVANK